MTGKWKCERIGVHAQSRAVFSKLLNNLGVIPGELAIPPGRTSLRLKLARRNPVVGAYFKPSPTRLPPPPEDGSVRSLVADSRV
jgi:hypothetical protein